jgi:hypothetical protein
MVRPRPNIRLRLDMWVIDRNGKRKVVNKPNDPICFPVIQVVYAMFLATNQNVTKIDGVNFLYAHTAFTATGGAGVDTNGIVIGTGANAVTIDDYSLQTKIAHGTGSGQMYYTAQVTTAPVKSGSTYTTEVYRQFINLSGAAITVNECGIYCDNSGSRFIWCRDTTGGIAVLDSAILLVNYKLQTTV